MKKLLVLAAFAMSLSACFTLTPRPPLTPPANSVALGERTVDFRADHDEINVGNADGLFRSLYFVVEKNDIELLNLTIVYGNGEREKIDMRLMFNEGSRSRLVDLQGGKRRIQSIQFNYRTVGTWQDGKAHVIVYGVR
jgi:hypothetical protein